LLENFIFNHLDERTSLDYEGSLHLTTALRKGAEKIISNDEDFDKTPSRRAL